MRKPDLKVGARLGGGPDPGFLWSVLYLSVAEDEAKKFLDETQYAHLVDQLRALASEETPTHPQTVSVDAVGDVWELREKWGPLARINVRVFFFVEKGERSIIVVGAIKKENDGKTPPATRRLMELRRRKYLNGDYGGVAKA